LYILYNIYFICNIFFNIFFFFFKFLVEAANNLLICILRLLPSIMYANLFSPARLLTVSRLYLQKVIENKRDVDLVFIHLHIRLFYLCACRCIMYVFVCKCLYMYICLCLIFVRFLVLCRRCFIFLRIRYVHTFFFRIKRSI
jgi:hypothetical protein